MYGVLYEWLLWFVLFACIKYVKILFSLAYCCNRITTGRSMINFKNICFEIWSRHYSLLWKTIEKLKNKNAYEPDSRFRSRLRVGKVSAPPQRPSPAPPICQKLFILFFLSICNIWFHFLFYTFNKLKKQLG